MTDQRPSSSLAVRHLYDKNYFRTQAFGGHLFGNFDGRPETLFGRARRNLELLALRPGERFLEVGCGRGEVSIAASFAGAEVCAVDYSESALRLAREKAAEVAGQRGKALPLSFVCGSAT